MPQASIIPTLASKHSGVPARLEKEAAEGKERLYLRRTLPNSTPRQSPLRLPPNISRDQFDVAIDALTKSLGAKALELNDKPLVDGWYMEHP
jgi:hypothetical protein